MYKKGFTLIELMVVISIIGLFTSIVSASLTGARENTKVSKAVTEIRQFQRAITTYVLDTNRYPTTSCMSDQCNASNDPFLNSLGVPGWNGPYLSAWNWAHPWKGHMGFWVGGFLSMDDDGDGMTDYWIFLDDDRPGTPTSDNGGMIPVSAMEKIDKLLDDGNINTGNMRGDGAKFIVGGIPSVPGEMVLKIYP